MRFFCLEHEKCKPQEVFKAQDKRNHPFVSGRIEHLIQIKDTPSARGREELLGEYAIDSHRGLSDKHGLAGKRDLLTEDDFKSGPLRIANENEIHTVIDFLSYLRLKGTITAPSSLLSSYFSACGKIP
ncbi:galanin peptides-like [Brienomyrus brachyistius]|uniref:galanin peptides-like n=1 Tax=Brienomyrus brachyistius TaxID=42636 RepID=UPI0020B1790A|nr:galanin peptides-like [Brienomyrus brachyistius]